MPDSIPKTAAETPPRRFQSTRERAPFLTPQVLLATLWPLNLPRVWHEAAWPSNSRQAEQGICASLGLRPGDEFVRFAIR